MVGKVVLVGLLVALGAARSLARVEVWRDTEHWYAALLRDAPLSYRTLWLRGDDAFAAHRWGTGEKLLRESIAAAPGIPGPREDLAGYYAQGRLWSQAEALLRGAMPLNFTRTRPWLLLPGVYLASGDTASALDWARRAAARFPDDAEVTASVLGVLLEAKRCADAATLLNERRDVLSAAATTRTEGLITTCR